MRSRLTSHSLNPKKMEINNPNINKIYYAKSGGVFNSLKVLVNTPNWFKAGIKFKSKWIKEGRNICTLLSFDKEKNTAEVRIKALDCEPFEETDWNLQHTIWGFENSDYTLIEGEQ